MKKDRGEVDPKLPQNAPPLVSVIVVNWNGEHLLKECLQALATQTYGQYEIILVDNSSTDGSVRLVRTLFPCIKIVELQKNLGFAGGNNEGLKACQGELIALLNNDTRADEHWLENLVQPMVKDASVGMCASKMIVDGTQTLDSAGNGFTTGGVGYNRGLSKDHTLFDRQEAVFGPCGGAGLYRRTMVEEIGFLDSDFYLYDEDVDLSFRAQLAGWKCLYVPQAVVYHKVNSTTGRLTDLHVYHHTRNLELVWIKNMPTGLMLRFAPGKLIQELGAFCYLCLRHRKWKAFLMGKIDVLRLLPRMVTKRRVIQKTRKMNNKDIQALLTPVLSRDFLAQKIQQLIKG